MAVFPKRIVAFSTFEVDLDAGEVRRAGLKVRLAGQPFRMLAALLSRPGDIVTREELQHEIWGDNTSVDFERGIASTVNKLREALGDSAEHPRYIETLARKGYRFIAPVTELTPVVPQREFIDPHPVELPAPRTTPPNEMDQTIPLRTPTVPLPGLTARDVGRGNGTFRSLLLCAIVCMIGAAAWAFLSLLHQPAPEFPPAIRQLTQTNLIYPGPPSPETLLALATDGPRIFLPELQGTHPELSSITLDGTDVQPLPVGDALRTAAISDISADHSRLLVRIRDGRAAEQPLWIVPTSGIGAQRVGDVLAHDATWMPSDPTKVLVATDNRFDVVQLDSGNVEPYAQLPGRAFWPRWAPDGSLLRFSLLNPTDHTVSLWELNPRHRQLKRLALPGLHAATVCCGSWTPAGDQFVFQAMDDLGSNLFALSTGWRPVLRQLTNGPIRFSAPLPSTDGHTLFAVGAAQDSALQSYDAAHHALTLAPSFLQRANRVSFSTDGTLVAWTDFQQRLWSARFPEGNDLVQLTPQDLQVFSATWSSDNQSLLLMARVPGGTWGIYTIAANGGTLHPLLANSRNNADPSWSPDNQQIVYGREADLMGQESGPHDIEVLNLKSGQSTIVPGSRDLFSPRWSPDGRYIAALSRDQAKLLLFSIAESRWTTLFSGGAADPVWSRDSHSILFHAFRQPGSGIYRAGVNGTVQTEVDLEKLGPVAESSFFSGVMPNGTPLIKPKVGTGDLYSIQLTR